MDEVFKNQYELKCLLRQNDATCQNGRIGHQSLLIIYYDILEDLIVNADFQIGQEAQNKNGSTDSSFE